MQHFVCPESKGESDMSGHWYLYHRSGPRLRFPGGLFLIVCGFWELSLTAIDIGNGRRLIGKFQKTLMLS